MDRQYFYKDNRDYLLHRQDEIVEFELMKVNRQLDATMRNMHRLKMDIVYYVGMVVVDYIVIWSLGPIVDFGDMFSKIIVAGPYVAAQFALLIFGPGIAHGIVKTSIMIRLNYFSERYTEVIRKYNIITYLTEQRHCQKVITRYQGYRRQLEDWMLDLQNEMLTMTEEDLQTELDKMDLNTQIPSANLHGSMIKTTTRLTWSLYLLLVLIAAASYWIHRYVIV